LGLVFDRGDGRPLPKGTLDRRLAAAIKKAGLPTLTPHGFRHSGASWLINVEEVPVKVVSELLGHASVRITLDLYTHADAETTRAAVEALERAAR
jgi:integrase